MTWVKICGITNFEDALTAIEAGADALGFVFYDKSPRKADVETTREIVGKLPGRVEKVGVFVDADSERIREVVSRTRLTVVQLHGERAMQRVLSDPSSTLQSIGVSRLIPAVPGDAIKNGGILLSQPAHDTMFALLLDAQADGGMGGTGTTFDWEATREVVQTLALQIPVIVAGGLTALNVGQAIKLFQPFGVDVSSGVEAYPGKKDPEKIRAFVQAARQADKKM